MAMTSETIAYTTLRSLMQGSSSTVLSCQFHLDNVRFATLFAFEKVEEDQVGSSLWGYQGYAQRFETNHWWKRRAPGGQNNVRHESPWFGPRYLIRSTLVCGWCQDRTLLLTLQHTRKDKTTIITAHRLRCGGARWPHLSHAKWSYHWTGPSVRTY